MEVLIYQDYQRDKVVFILRERRGEKNIHYGFNGKKLIEQEFNINEVPSKDLLPTLELQSGLAHDFITAVVEFADKKGIKPESDSVNSGKLIATEKHLTELSGNFTKVLDVLIKKLY